MELKGAACKFHPVLGDELNKVWKEHLTYSFLIPDTGLVAGTISVVDTLWFAVGRDPLVPLLALADSGVVGHSALGMLTALLLRARVSTLVTKEGKVFRQTTMKFM